MGISIFSSPSSVPFYPNKFPPERIFITELLQQRQFLESSLLIFQDSHNHDDSVTTIVQVAQVVQFKPSYLIKHHNYNFTYSHIPPNRFLPSAFHFRRKSSQRKLVILMISEVRSDLLKSMYKLITPVYIPITRKDEDFYIFVTPPKLHEQLLLMEELPNRIKFKIAVGQNQHSEALKVRTICFFCNPNGSPKLVEFPVDTGKPLHDINYFPDFAKNLNGKVLEISIPYVRAEIEADPPWTGIKNARRGNWKNLFEEYLMVKFNFTYHMFVSTGADGNIGAGGSGARLPNGSWTGVVADLISGRAHLGIASSHTTDRIRFVDFTNSYFYKGCLTFVTAQPHQYFSPLAFLWPFALEPWLGILCSSIVFLALSFIASRITSKMTIGSLAHLLLCALLEQAYRPLPTTRGLRLLLAFWLYFVMVITTLYKSKLVTLLAFPVSGELPQKFDDLVYSDFKIGFVKHGESGYNTLASSNDSVYVRLVAEMEVFTDDGLICLNKAVNHKYGCIAYDFALLHLVQRNLSDAERRKLVFAPAKTYNIYTGIVTEGKSIFRLNFSKWLSYIMPFHLPDVWEKMDMYKNVRLPKKRWWASTNQTDKRRRFRNDDLNQGKHVNLTMKHTVGIFYVLFICLLFALLLFIIELVVRKFQGQSF